MLIISRDKNGNKTRDCSEEFPPYQNEISLSAFEEKFEFKLKADNS